MGYVIKMPMRDDSGEISESRGNICNTIKYGQTEKAFQKAAYTIKRGETVVKDGKILKTIYGKTFWVNNKFPAIEKIKDDLKRNFRKYWTVEYENYIIPESYLHSSAPVLVK